MVVLELSLLDRDTIISEFFILSSHDDDCWKRHMVWLHRSSVIVGGDLLCCFDVTVSSFYFLLYNTIERIIEL